MVLTVVLNYIGLIFLLSIPFIHAVNFELKVYSLIKHNIYFSTTLFKNLIFEENCVFFAWRKFCALLYVQNFAYFMGIEFHGFG